MSNDTEGLFTAFLESEDTLRICRDREIIFQSEKKGIVPLIEYLEAHGSSQGGVTACDRVTGAAAALLLKKAGCREVYSVIGSKLAGEVLQSYDITYVFMTEVPFIINRTGTGMCPFEEASIGRSADEFFEYAKRKIS